MSAKGGVTVPLNWCVFSEFDSLLHDTISTDPQLLVLLENVYAVCIAQRSSQPKKIVGGFFVRTSYTDKDEEFAEALASAMASIPAFSKFDPVRHSFLPARVKAALDITEDEMLTLLLSQKLKFTTAGNA
ncbi:hypothetical protein LXA47_19420 [Massilia sp. P8910]|uniref:hypothetical protein n=1 Tax=Massilia antarctica TaxID=2765360 RepID=UPI001E4E06B2|nr:hypothetical protein [Massilia antarctica]MCE3605758.1 hypothetical protein [Massilia antarctica]